MERTFCGQNFTCSDDNLLFKKTDFLKTERYNEAKKLNEKEKSKIFTVKGKANDDIGKKIYLLDEIQNNYYEKIKTDINFIKQFINS